MAILKTEKDPTLIKIGEKIRKIRKQNPDYVNYEVFAFTHRINKVTLQRIEKGENYNIESLLKVLKALNIGLSDFFKDID
jgi:transcriptional regulator with XRE-family HTH domain